MSVKIIDEKQTGKTRLLILDNRPALLSNTVIIDDNTYEALIVYDLKNAIAIICNASVNSMIGKELKQS